MPIPRLDYVPLPAVIPRRVSDTRTLGDLLRRQGENALQFELAKGQTAAQLWRQLGQVFSSYAQGRREDDATATALKLRKEEREAADQLKRAELAERKAERDEAARLRKEAEKRQLTADAVKVGDAVAEAVGYGPMSEPQMEQVLGSPAQAGRARYSFGPGTAEGPELLPTKDQARMIEVEQAVKQMGGIMGPNGGIHMPPKPPAPPAPPNVGSFEDYVIRKFGPNPSPEQIENARRAYSDQGRAEKAPVIPGTLPPSTQRRLDVKVRAFEAQPAVKKAQTMADSIGFAQSLDPNTKNPADDQALIYAFAKAMDPESVVREGEYATVQKYAQSWAQTLGFNAQRIFSNTSFLTPEARKNMKATILSRFKSAKQQYDAVRKSYSDQINKITGSDDGEGYLTDYGAAFPADAPPPPGPPKPKVTRDANGNLVAPPKGGR
jgi:hypothetical protein